MTESRSFTSPLERAKFALRKALHDACDADLDRADTGEFIRIEGMLAIANEAAKEAISARRLLHTEKAAAISANATAAPVNAPPTSREIEDATGIRWSVFAVYPSLTNDRTAIREQLRDGWLSFDSGTETRRLVPIPSDWQAASDVELLALWTTAQRAPRRQR